MPNVEGFQFACSLPDCGEVSFKRGLCRDHYRAAQKDWNREKGSWRRSKSWKYVKMQVLIRDNYLCQIKLSGCLEQATTADHIIPSEDGGELFDLDNLQAACVKCNSAKELEDRKTRDYDAIGRRKYGSVERQ